MVLVATQSVCKRRKSYENQTNVPTEIDWEWERDEQERER